MIDYDHGLLDELHSIGVLSYKQMVTIKSTETIFSKIDRLLKEVTSASDEH